MCACVLRNVHVHQRKISLQPVRVMSNASSSYRTYADRGEVQDWDYTHTAASVMNTLFSLQYN